MLYTLCVNCDNNSHYIYTFPERFSYTRVRTRLCMVYGSIIVIRSLTYTLNYASTAENHVTHLHYDNMFYTCKYTYIL